MTNDNQNQPKHLFLLLLIFLLFVIICVQAWRMLVMEQKLNTLGGNEITLQLPIKTDEASTAETGDVTATSDASTGDQDSSDMNKEPLELTPPDDNDFTDRSFDHWGTNPWESNPYDDIRRMQQEMKNIFNDIDRKLSNQPEYRHHFRQHISSPNIDIREDANQYRVMVNIPGVDARDIAVNLRGQRLSISAKQDYRNESRNEAGNFMFREHGSGRIQRSIMLREPVNPDGVKTRVDNGVLMIMIPKVRRHFYPQMP